MQWQEVLPDEAKREKELRQENVKGDYKVRMGNTL